MTSERFRRFAAPAALALTLGACHFGGDDVETRAVQRWKYLIAHQAEKAYDYLTPGTQATQTRESYAAMMNNRPVKWTDAKFKHKDCDADRCKLTIDVSYSVMMPGAGALGTPVQSTSTQTETWVRVKDNWYFLPKSLNSQP